MNVTLISGSPRKANSEKMNEYMKDLFETNGHQVQLINLRETILKPCIHCNFCQTKDFCTHDKIANEVNEKLAGSDAIIFTSPVYFGSMTGQMKILLDKTLPLRRNGFRLKNKIGAAVAVGGSRNGGQEFTIQNIHAAMLIHGMTVVGDNNHFGGIVHEPFLEDSVGKETLKGTVNAVCELLSQ